MWRAGVLMGVVLAGCMPEANQPPAPDTCGATALKHLIGHPEAALTGVRFAQPVRITHPGDAVTMDYNQSRLNIGIDAQGNILALKCG